MLEAGKRYSQIVSSSFHISMACLKGIDCKYNFYVPVYELNKNGFSRIAFSIEAIKSLVVVIVEVIGSTWWNFETDNVIVNKKRNSAKERHLVAQIKLLCWIFQIFLDPTFLIMEPLDSCRQLICNLKDVFFCGWWRVAVNFKQDSIQ